MHVQNWHLVLMELTNARHHVNNTFLRKKFGSCHPSLWNSSNIKVTQTLQEKTLPS